MSALDRLNQKALRSRGRMVPDTSREMEIEEDELIHDAITENEQPLSNCCGQPFIDNSDLCQECGEHAVAEIADFTFPGNRTVFTITYDPVTKDVLELHQNHE